MSETIVDRVAKALQEAWDNDPTLTPIGFTEMEREGLARAAIKAMREPTKPMLYACRQALCTYIKGLPQETLKLMRQRDGGYRFYDEDLKATLRFQSMIDAALK